MRNSWGGSSVHDCSKGGWTTRDLRSKLREVTNNLLCVCLVFIGLNDILKGVNLKSSIANFKQIIKY